MALLTYLVTLYRLSFNEINDTVKQNRITVLSLCLISHHAISLRLLQNVQIENDV
jgi:hypothetical protein